MLVLSRKRDESIVVSIPPGYILPEEGMRIEVSVVDIRGDKARLGVNADPKISIHRKEVQDRIDRENRKKSE